jgi:hypothetical protein
LRTLSNKQIALGAFLDIEEAFDRTSFEAIAKAANWHGVKPTICTWINFMLESRSMVATLSWEILEVAVTRGRVPSPLMWSLVVNELIVELSENGYYAKGYADDIAILINGKFLQSWRYYKLHWD